MPPFAITVKRITDNDSPQIKELIALDQLKGKKRLPYEPLPDAQVSFSVEANNRREAYRYANACHGLRFTGQKCEVWVDGALELH